jgi:hypothetical protein
LRTPGAISTRYVAVPAATVIASHRLIRYVLFVEAFVDDRTDAAAHLVGVADEAPVNEAARQDGLTGCFVDAIALPSITSVDATAQNIERIPTP